MAWIQIIDTSEATGELKEVYRQLTHKRGKMSNIMSVQSLNPAAMKAHLDLYLSVMFRNRGLRREQREMIGVVVSLENKCAYCVNHHAEALRFYWKNEDRIQQLIRDFSASDIAERDKAMLAYARKLTVQPTQMTSRDVQALRDSGFADREILDINLIASYFNFVNRIANGLGVEFDPEEATGYDY